MDLRPHLDNLRHEFEVAAAAGGDDLRALAERLSAPLESAMRLTLLDALSAAAGEITRDIAPGSVDLRLRGRDPEFVVTLAPPGQTFEEAVERAGTERGTPAPPGGEEVATSRINLRLPEDLKVRIEEAAGRERLSVNSWLVRTVAAAVEPDDPGHRVGRRPSWGGQRYTGWVS